MDDRYRPRRPRSPTYNPGRASLPINVGHVPTFGGYHLHAVPGRQEVISNPRSSGDRLAGPVTATTYKIAPDIPGRSNSVRDSHRNRSSTVDAYGRPGIPTITTTGPRYRPVIHSAVPSVASPSTIPYRSEEDYYSVPATSNGRDHRDSRYYHKRYSTMDNSDVGRITEGHDEDRLGVGYDRDAPRYAGTRSRPTHSRSLVRHADTVADDYGDDGYGYTNPKDLAKYDLEHGGPRHYSHARRDSFEPRSRPANLPATYYDGGGYSRSYDNRDRGPQSARGFDRLTPSAAPYEHTGSRMPSAQQPPPVPAGRPSTNDTSLDADDPRRNSRRPVSLYQDRDHRHPHGDEYYEREDDLRERFERRHEHHDDRHSERREERRDDRYDDRYHDRYDDRTRPGHSDRSDRPDKAERDDRSDYKDKRDHSLRDALVGLAATSLGLSAATKGSKDDDRDNDRDSRSDRDEPKRSRDKDHGDETRKKRDYKEDGDTVDLTGRDPVERPRQDDPKEKSRRDERDGRDRRESDGETHSRRKPRRDSDTNSNAIDDSSDSAVPSRSRQPRSRTESGPSTPFNPKDTMDLKALKEALAAKDASKKESPPIPPKEPLDEARPESSGKDDRGRSEEQYENRQIRVVSPPREKSTEKPVKGILRQPRERFPEDPMPIREGVAPHKDAKKDGIPPDARWTKISRRLVNPEALERGMERYEAREDFVIVLRVLTKDEVQGYANLTQRIREEREEAEELARRRARRERHERHKRESYGSHRHRSRYDGKDVSSHSESDTTDYDDDDRYVYNDRREKPKMLEGPPSKSTRPLSTAERAIMSGGLGP